MRRVLALIVLALLAAACGGDPTAPSTLRVLMADDWADTPAVLDVVRAFEAEHPGVLVQVVPRPFNQIPDEVREAQAADRPVDVVHHHAFSAGALGLAAPLDDRWAADDLQEADFFPGAIEDVTWGSTRYGIPLDVNALVMLVDADLGETPETFADVERLAARVTAGDRRGLTVPANAWETYGWIKANGGDLVEFDDDGTPHFTFDSPEVVQTLDFLGGLVADGLAYGPLTRNVSLDAFELFRAGDTAMLATGTWTLAEIDRSSPDLDVVTTTLPVGEDGGARGSVLGGSSLFVARGSSQVDLALEFIDALTADDVAVRLALEEGRFPPRPDLYDRLAGAPGADVLETQLRSAHPMRLIAFPTADAAFVAAVDRVLTGQVDAQTALADAQAAAEEAMGS